jgi:transposase
MKLHANARTCLHSRSLIVRRVLEEGWTLARAAEAAGVSVRTVSKWLARFRAEGLDGLLDRSSAPELVPGRTAEERVELVAALRRLRMTAAEIAETLSMPLSTVSVVLNRIGLGKLSRLEPPEPANRYERQRPGELLHIDVKKLGRIGRPGHRVNGDRRTRVTRDRLGVRPRLRRRRDPHRLRRGARRRESVDRGRLPPPRRRLLPRQGDPGRAGDDR